MDSESETLVNETVSSLMQDDTTTISIAHRLSTIKQCDIIYVLDGGKLVEQGTFSDLIRKGNKGAFYKLVQWQLSGLNAANRE